MKQYSDDSGFWDSEAAYMPMGGLGADATAPAPAAPVPWWQSLISTAGDTYAAVTGAKAAANQPAGTAPVAVSSGPSTQTMLMYGALGVGAIFLISTMMKKKRR